MLKPNIKNVNSYQYVLVLLIKIVHFIFNCNDTAGELYIMKFFSDSCYHQTHRGYYPANACQNLIVTGHDLRPKFQYNIKE